MILIQTANANTLASLVNGLPDLSDFTEPTLSILQTAFDAGNYTIVGEPESMEPEQRPNWNAFMIEMDARGLFMVGLTANFAVFTQIFNMLLAMRDKQSLPNEECIEWRNFKLMYGLGRAAFSGNQLAEIEAAMTAANIPLIQ